MLLEFLELCNSCGAARICLSSVEIQIREHISSFWHPFSFSQMEFEKTKTWLAHRKNIGYQFLVAALNFHLLFMKHWGGGWVSFKYPGKIVGKICPPWPPPQCHEFCGILWAHCCIHLGAPMFPSNQGVFPSPFCFFSPRTTFKGHVKKHTGISLVISPPNPKKREKGISMIHAKACSSSFPQGRSPLNL